MNIVNVPLKSPFFSFSLFGRKLESRCFFIDNDEITKINLTRTNG